MSIALLRHAGFAALMLVLLGLVFTALTLALSDLAYQGAEREVSFWGRPGYSPAPAAIERAQGQIEMARRWWPTQPEYLRLHARLLMWRAYWNHNAMDAAQTEAQALQRLTEAAVLRPAHRASWQELALELTRLHMEGPELERVQRQLQQLAQPLAGRPRDA